MQERRQPPKSCGSSFNLHAGISNNTREAVAISMQCRFISGGISPTSRHARGYAASRVQAMVEFQGQWARDAAQYFMRI
jgi:hypothetical protein